MWEILNIKTRDKGWHKRIRFAYPFRSQNFDSDFRIDKITQFILWLTEWENFNSNGVLTPETFHALILTFKSLLSFMTYLFKEPEKLGLDFTPGYLLTAKLQTDILEKRFGTYRQLNGAAYLMTFKEIISAEKKIRIRTRIKLGNIKFNISDIDNDQFNIPKGDLILDLDYILDDLENIESMLEYNPKELGAILYISGAIAYRLKTKISCSECFESLVDRENSYDIDSCNETDYFDTINRGALIKPSMMLLSVVKICINFFELYIRPALGSTIKHPSSCQLREVLYNFLERVNFFDDLPLCDVCDSNKNCIIKDAIRILSNIILNNFCKMYTDLNKENKYNKSYGIKNQKKD